MHRRFVVGRTRLFMASALAAVGLGVGGGAVLAGTGNPQDIDTVTMTNDAAWFLDQASGPLGFNSFGVQDAQTGAKSDAFDGGLALSVGGAPVFAADGQGVFRGQDFSVRTEAGGLEVAETMRAMSGDGTLDTTFRVLVELRNRSTKTVTKNIGFGSDLGSDGDTVRVATSSGKPRLNPTDRWLVTADNATTPSDVVVAHVFGGKGQTVKPDTVAQPGARGASVVFNSYRVKVPKRSARYMLFFARLDDDPQDAVLDMMRFDPRKLDSELLDGIRGSVRRQIVNWDLVG